MERVIASYEFQHLFYLRGNDAEGVAILIMKQFFANLFQQSNDALPLFWCHQQSLARGIGEEVIVSQATAKLGVTQQFGVEEQCPAFGMDFLAHVGLATYLAWGYAHQGVAMQDVLKLSVRQILQFLVTDEHTIHVVVVERVAAMLQLVVVDDRDERMQFRCTDVSGIVVDLVNS